MKVRHQGRAWAVGAAPQKRRQRSHLGCAVRLACKRSRSPPPPLWAQEERRSVTDCAATRPEECEALRYALFACRRGQVDARSRIQGNKGY